MRVNPAAEPLYIVNPLQATPTPRGGMVREAVLDPPPMEERVARLAGCRAQQPQLQRF